jgi:hypothetical protein
MAASISIEFPLGSHQKVKRGRQDDFFSAMPNTELDACTLSMKSMTICANALIFRKLPLQRPNSME